MATCVAVAVMEAVTWNAPGFLIGYGVLSLGLAGIYALLYKGHALRWLLFAYLLFLGAYTFLLGGLHMGVFNEDPVDPLCYVLAAAGLALVGMGGFTTYSEQVEEYLRSLVTKSA